MNGSFNNSSLFLEWVERGRGGGETTIMAARKTTVNTGGMSMARFVLVRGTGFGDAVVHSESLELRGMYMKIYEVYFVLHVITMQTEE